MMDSIEKRAREMVMAELPGMDQSRFDHGVAVVSLHVVMRLLRAALTPPEGYVLVPVEPTEEMLDSVPTSTHPRLREEVKRLALEEWRKMIAARPEATK